MAEFGPKDVCVVIPTRDRWEILARTIAALRDQTVAGFEVLVVVDGTDQRVPALDGATVVTKEHGGPGAARNLGARTTSRPLVLFVGDDMVPTRELVAAHLERHRANPAPEVAVLGRSDWHPDAHGRINRWLDWSATQFDFGSIDGSEAGFGHFYSSNVSLKRDFFLEAGGFDEDFVYYYEDLDCGWRLSEKGMRLLYEPRARTLHLHRLSWSDVVRRFRGIAAGEYLMARKHAWFTPFFRDRVRRAATARRAAPIWPLIADRVPRSRAWLRTRAERRANTSYYQRLAPDFIDAWEAQCDLEELREYLGDSYDPSRLSGHLHELNRELEAAPDEKTFYRSSEAYLYDLTVFALSATKVPYRRDLAELVPAGARLLDWGCGIGADGFRFIAHGYDVAFADFDNPSTRYLRWRLARRGIDASVYDIDNDEVPGGYDAAYAFDVIEHVDDPFELLDALERRAGIVMVNLLDDEPDAAHHPHHRALPIRAILDHADRKGLVRYRLYHGRSHLIAYRGRSVEATGLSRVRSIAQRHLGARLSAVRRR